MKDTTFYNEESVQYSSKRYRDVAETYIQFFFNRRLSITKRLVAEILKQEEKPLSLLELGCADGVVVRALQKAFPDAFSHMVGIDISPAMIEEARKYVTDKNTEFLLRQEYNARPPVSIITETGVINYAGFDSDMTFALENIKEKGWYVLSVAGTDSLRNQLKGEGDFVDFRSYKEYERILRKNFFIHRTIGCGLFIPHIWKAPFIARPIQLCADVVFGYMFPDLCHEKVYLLRKK